MIDLGIVKKHSSRNLALLAISFSCAGGVELGRGIQELIASRWLYQWTTSFLIGSVFLACGIFWSVMLVRRTNSNTTEITK